MTDGIKELEQEIRQRSKRLDDLQRNLKAAADVEVMAGIGADLHDLRGDLREAIAKQHREIKQTRKELHEARADQDGTEQLHKWLVDQLGTTENPAGSNWGHPVQDWTLWMGYGSGVPHPPWCGIFAGFGACKIGGAEIPTPIRLGYSGYITEDARAHRNGLVAVPVEDARLGDIFAYGTVHVGVCVGPTRNGQVEAIEGNTSPGTEGSQYNGGCVAHKSRPVTFVTTCARPAY